jgi:hypothetical protein
VNAPVIALVLLAALREAPPFPASEAWIGPRVTWADLRGRVVLLDVWTFG